MWSRPYQPSSLGFPQGKRRGGQPVVRSRLALLPELALQRKALSEEANGVV